MTANNNYFHELINQMETAGVNPSDEIHIVAKEGSPAVIIENLQGTQRVFLQNSTLDKLEEISKVS